MDTEMTDFAVRAGGVCWTKVFRTGWILRKVAEVGSKQGVFVESGSLLDAEGGGLRVQFDEKRALRCKWDLTDTPPTGTGSPEGTPRPQR